MYKSPFFFMSPEVTPFISLVLAIDLILKGVTLYKSAQRDQKFWFVALLLVNSLGILPIVYLVLSKDIVYKPTTKSVSSKVAPKRKR